MGFQSFVRRGGGKSGFSFFPQLSDINATFVATNLAMMSNESYALLENNRAIGENAALNNSATHTARHQARSRSADARRSRSASDAGDNDSDGEDDGNDAGDEDDGNDGGDGDGGKEDGGEGLGGEGQDGG